MEKTASEKIKATKKKVQKVATVDKDEMKKQDAAQLEKDVKEIMDKLSAEQAEKNAEKAKQFGEWKKPRRGMKLDDPDHSRKPMEPPNYMRIPEFLDTNDGGRRRLKEEGYQYRWGRFKGTNPKVPAHRMKGWRPVMFDDYCKDTGWYERTPDGYIANGDCILIRISNDGYQKLVDEKNRLNAIRDRMGEDGFFAEAESLGIQSFKDHGDRLEFMT